MPELVLDGANTSRDQVLDAIILAFKYSQLKAVAASRGFKSLLDDQWESIVPKGDTLMLQPVLEILSKQKGFNFDKAIPPLCRIKTWEMYLKLRVELPKDFVRKGIIDAGAQAMSCRVPEAELAKVLPSSAMGMGMNSGPRLSPIAKKAAEAAAAQEAKPKHVLVKVLGGVFGILAVVLGVAAFFYFRTLPVDINLVSDSIPLVEAKRSGATITAVLRDRAWLSFPKAEREDAVRGSFLMVRKLDARELKVVDNEGKLIAQVRLEKAQPVVDLKE